MGNLVLTGATSGSITLEPTAVAGSNTITLPANTGTILTTGSSGQSIPKAALPTGSVLQVVQATSTSAVTVNTNTYTDTGLSASITPTSSSSKIFVFVNQEIYTDRTGSYVGGGLKLIRGSTDIFTPITDGTGPYDLYSQGGTNPAIAIRYCINYLDSPATTSSTTYKTQGRPYQAGIFYVQGTQVMILMEIAA